MKLYQKTVWAAILLIGILFGLKMLVNFNDSSGMDWGMHVKSTVITSNKTVINYDSALFDMTNRGDVVVITVEFPKEKYVADSALLFSVDHCVVSAYFENEMLYTRGRELAEKDHLIGGVYPQLWIPDEAWGDEIKIVLEVQEDNAFTQIKEFRLYPQLQAYHYYSLYHIVEFLWVLAALIGFTIAFVMLCIFTDGKSRIQGLLVVGFGLMFSIRAFIYYGFYNLFSASYFWSVMEYMSQSLATVCIMWHLYLVNEKYKKLWKIAALLNSGYLIVICILHAANIRNFHETLTVTTFVAVADCFLILGFSLKGHLKKLSTKILRASIYFMAAVLFVDLIRFLLSSYVPAFYGLSKHSILVFAVCVYAIILLCYLFEYIFEEREEKIRIRITSERSIEQLTNSLELNRLKIALTQIQPHFMYNILSSIQVIVKRDPDYAYNLLYDFMIYLRANIHTLQNDQLIPFNKELANIEAYLNIAKMCYPGRLEIEYELTCTDFLVAPLSIEPLVENAVQHGVLPRQGTVGKITISSFETDADWVIEVNDDGVGFDTEAIADDTHVGLKNIKYRLETMMHARLSMKSSPGSGTQATVYIPKGSDEDDENHTS